MSSDTASRQRWSWILTLGLLWGLTEVLLGAALRAGPARELSGSFLTGLSYLFIVAAYRLGGVRGAGIALAATVSLKLGSAAILGVSCLSGRIATPVYAYTTEVLAWIAVASLLPRAVDRVQGQALTGALSALTAALLFLLAPCVTGSTACLKSGTTCALALYYAPLAVAVAAVCAPLGARSAAGLTHGRCRPVRPATVFALDAALTSLCMAATYFLRS